MGEGFSCERLYTKQEFQEYLDRLCANEKSTVSYILTDGFNNRFVYGNRGDKEANLFKKISLKNGFEVKIEAWGESDLDVTYYEKIFTSYWNNDYSDKTTGIPTTEHADVLDKCNRTLQFYYKEHQNVALIMIDLDNFRNVNNLNNHDVGSRVLGEFARLIFSSFIEGGIIIHQTGDEFNVLMPYVDLVDVIDSVKKARDLIGTHKFEDAPDVELSMSVGIKCIENEQLDYIQARNMAEEIYSNSSRKNATKQRDSIRISGCVRQAYSEINLKFAWTRVISNLDGTISNNVFLEYIKKYANNIDNIVSFSEQIKDIVEWINPTWSNDTRFLKNICTMDSDATFSKVDLCLAIIQGLLKNPNFISNQFILKYEYNKLNIYMDCNIILSYEVELDDSKTFEGRCGDCYRGKCSNDCRRVLLVQAGYEESQLMEDLFHKIIHVDTRPTTGGGLPDFWAATLCELITIMQDYPLVTDILIYGNTDYTRNIVEVLSSIKQWDDHERYNLKYISQKTFKSVEDINKFKSKFQNHIGIYSDKEQLYNKVCQIYSDKIEMGSLGNSRKTLVKRRILQRDLAYEKIGLNIYDGCHVRTIADAYPIVLEILRKQKRECEKEIKDQAGRNLVELIDFKIVLSEPSSVELPDYYISDEKLLNDYYAKIFGDDDSLFRKELNKNAQLDTMIKHVIQAVTCQKQYATRRAVLVVANEVEDEDNFSPLGLISIWLAPRFDGNRVVLDFSYNWRTVEAVVGLPLSMYASVKFAEEVTSLIKERVAQSEYSITMGKVSYIAHSLHMFLDCESMGIVRGIINDASI